ncbi:MAG TPA: PP2C family protein-serine/threonine phosphatase [Candidatus Acidoferrum sp.]|jgi:hypothetical protein
MLQEPVLAALAAPSPPTVFEWRWAIFSIGIGSILLTIGGLATVIFLFRRKTAGRALFYLGIFVILYAVRIFVRELPLLSVFAIPRSVAAHIERAITFTIAVPAILLFLEVVQTRWRRVMLWTLGVQVAFAAIAIPLDFLHIAPTALDRANSVLVLVSWVLLAALVFFLGPPGRMPSELRVVALGLGVFGLFVVYTNLVALRILPGRDVESAGFLFFVCTIGYLVVHRIFLREESLFAIQKELQIAEQIQASILPREVPRLAGIDIAARYLPMSAVAGDFYDFLLVGRHQLGVLVADVTGHGVPAALIASMLKVAFAGQSEHVADPARVLSGLNKVLCGKFEDHFVTAAYLYADLDAKIVRYAGAGHPPLLVCNRTGGGVRTLEQNGLFLGMFPEAEYSSVEVRLQPGDIFVLYTDGLPESKNDSEEEFGISRCLKVLDSQPRLPAGALADRLLGEISRWSTTVSGTARPQEDDMTLIVIDCQV